MSSRFFGNTNSQFPLGFASGLPLLLTGSTLTAWLTDSGYSFTEIGLFALVAYPYNFKFLWAPLFDSIAPPWLTRRRGWIVLLQLATAAMLALMSLAAGPDAELFRGLFSVGSATALVVLATAVATLSASLDIVTDAYRADVLEDHERGAGAAAGVAGYRVAMIVAGAGALIAADHIGFAWVYRGFAVLLAMAAVITVFVPVAPKPADRPSLASAVWKPMVEFFSRDGAIVILLLVALYRVGDAASQHMVVPFLLDIGYGMSEIGLLQKGFGMGASVAGAIVGGIVCDKLGLRRTLLGFAALQAVANAGYMLLPGFAGSSVALALAVVVDNFCNGLGFAALVVLLLGLCHRDFSAFQYALFTSATTVIGRTLSAFSGPVIAAVDWTGYFAASIAIAVPGLLLILWVSRRYPHAFDKRAAD